MAALLEAITNPAVLDRLVQQSPDDLPISYTYLALPGAGTALVSIAGEHQHDETDGYDE